MSRHSSSVLVRQLVRFGASGAANTIVGGCIILLLMAVGVQYLVANAAGYAAGFVLSYFLNRSWTFEVKSRVGSGAPQFILVVAVAYAANLSLVLTLVEGAGVNRYAAQVCGIGTYAVLSFLGMKYFAFRK
jgi:putative flippase GtrA